MGWIALRYIKMMMMNNMTNKIPAIIYRFIVGTITPEERAVLDGWMNENPENRKLFERLTNLNNLQKEVSRRASIDTERPMHDMMARIEREMRLQQPARHATTKRIARWLAGAAAAILIVAGVAVQAYKLGLSRATKAETEQMAQAAVITHGETKAMLTLSNGESVELGADNQKNSKMVEQLLSKGIETQEQGAEAPTLCLKTPRGGEFKVTLEDGTEVWLNAESQLQYPETFDADERRVAVTGEAYFKVAKDSDRPFYVETAGQLVRVYGTEFNIHSYEEDSNVYTTLVSGSIALSPLDGNGSEIVLTPGHQAVFDKQDVTSSIRSVDTSIVTSWRNGKFVFENLTLEQIMITLSRWYDFDYEFQDMRLRSTIFMGSVPRYGEFSEILSILEKSGGIRFTQQGKTVLINHK